MENLEKGEHVENGSAILQNGVEEVVKNWFGKWLVPTGDKPKGYQDREELFVDCKLLMNASWLTLSM